MDIPSELDFWSSRRRPLGPVSVHNNRDILYVCLKFTPSLIEGELTPRSALVIFTLAAGFTPSIQSYGTSLVRGGDIAPFYSFLAVARIAGTLVGSPLTAAAFNLGLRVGGAGLGMHFYVSAGFFSIAGMGAWMVGLFDRGERRDECEDGV